MSHEQLARAARSAPYYLSPPCRQHGEVPRSPSPGLDSQGQVIHDEVAGIEVSFDMEEDDDVVIRQDSQGLALGINNEHAMDRCTFADPCILPPLPLSPSASLSAPRSPSAVSEPQTPPSSTGSSFVYITTPTHGSSETLDIPILLLSTEEDETWRRLRSQSAPTLDTSTMDASQSFVSSPKPDDSHLTGSSKARETSWAGLKRTLSLGSTSSVSLGRANSRRLSKVAESSSSSRGGDRTSRARQLRIAVPQRPSHQRGYSLDEDRNNGSPDKLPPGTVPSGPSSPSSPHHHPLPSPLDDQIKVLTCNFPQPPGRVVSGFSDMHDGTGWLGLDAVVDGIFDDSHVEGEAFATIASASALGKNQVITRGDSSPTFPFVDVLPTPTRDEFPSDVSASEHTHTHIAYPPSPALTPSPNLSLTDTIVLKTPESPNTIQRDGVERSYRRRFKAGEASHRPSNYAEDQHSTPLSPRGDQTAETSASISASPRTSSSCTTIGDLVHSYTTTSPPGGKTMGQDWRFDPATETHQPTPLPLAHPFHHDPTPSIPSSARTSSSLNDSSLASPPASYAPLSRRHSRFTAFSGSSPASSIHSSESSSLRHEPRHWGLGEKPDISTVFEEASQDETAVDHTANSSPTGSADRKDPSTRGVQLKDLTQRDFRSNSPTLPTSISYPSLSAPQHDRLRSQASQSTLSSRFARHRTDRIGSISSERSPQPTVSTEPAPHPFASPVVRPVSPLPYLNLPPRSLNMPSSKSHPNLHDMYNMPPPLPAHQVTLSEQVEDESESCPVCNESLAAEFRIPGEKPHVQAECGHEVHYDCFKMCYVHEPEPGSSRSYGVCGMCRQPMRVVEPGGRSRKGKKTNKLAALMGQQSNDNPSTPQTQTLSSAASILSGGPAPSPSVSYHDQDDPLVAAPTMGSSFSGSRSTRSIASDGQNPISVVVPAITVRSEFSSVSKTKPSTKGHFLSTMVTVAVPTCGDRGRYPPGFRPSNFDRRASGDANSPRTPESPMSPPVDPTGKSESVDPFARIVTDMQNRLVDYKHSGLDTLGSLRVFDILSVRKGNLMREFNVYLFDEALICVTEEKKSGLRNLFSSGKSDTSATSSKTATTSRSASARGPLKLKGRIYLKHVKLIADSSEPGELSLTIVMIDERMDSFILVFKDRGSHSTWKAKLEQVVIDAKGAADATQPVQRQHETSKKLAKMMGSDYPGARAGGTGAGRIPTSASTGTTFGDMITSPSTAGYSSATTPATSAFNPVSPHLKQEPTLGDLVYSPPIAPQHTPIDVVVVLSLPTYNMTQGKIDPRMHLKPLIMRQTLSFVLATLGPRDRVSLVSAEMGANGVVRKTPFLNPTKYESRRRLEAFVDLLGSGRQFNDDFEVTTGPDDKMDVVTAMNVALDGVLQRKAKNPIGSMIVISNSTENIKRAQMDLVSARLETANVPVHAVGFGKGHDPSPLWLISNNTQGTYTFVDDWYGLRETVAGVFGGLTSIAMTNMRLLLTCPDSGYKVVRIQGANNHVIQQEGKVVDIELKELRFGDTREVMVEIDLINPAATTGNPRHSGSSDSNNGPSQPSSSGHGSMREGSSMGMDRFSVADATSALADMSYESNMIDEEPVLQVDCSYHDPAAGRSVSRLTRPLLLTVTVLPPSATPSTASGDATLIRRRMELLTSDMITRALLIASRRNYIQASRILSQTKTIIHSVADRLQSSLPPSASKHTFGTSQRELGVLASLEGMSNVMADLDILIDGLEQHPEMFERDSRNFAAQQSLVLRAQKSWSVRSPAARMYCTHEVMELIRQSGAWMPDRNRAE